MTACAALPAIRSAQPTDAGQVGAILSHFIERTEWMPRLYSQAQELSFAGTMIDQGWVTVAEPQGPFTGIAGFMAMESGFVHALYVDDAWCGQGLGRALLDHAKTRAPRLELRTFLKNVGAQRFYIREGFRIASHGDGTDNDEGLPDVFLIWERNAT